MRPQGSEARALGGPRCWTTLSLWGGRIFRPPLLHFRVTIAEGSDGGLIPRGRRLHYDRGMNCVVILSIPVQAGSNMP